MQALASGHLSQTLNLHPNFKAVPIYFVNSPKMIPYGALSTISQSQIDELQLEHRMACKAMLWESYCLERGSLNV